MQITIDDIKYKKKKIIHKNHIMGKVPVYIKSKINMYKKEI